ncbi:MAG: RNA polymerase sigma factor, partial [Candidatus Limnocylindrales bacterium]
VGDGEGMRRDLVEAASRGDHEAFEVLATSAGDRLYAVARLILRTTDLAEDAVQEALVRAWQQLPSLRDPDRFDAWLHRLVVNACADQGWPYEWTAFKVRLFAGDTVVEQLVFAPRVGSPGLVYMHDGLATNIAPTTEDGRPIVNPHDVLGGEVTIYVAHPWVSFGDRSAFVRLIPDGPTQPTTDGGQRNDWVQLVVIADPLRTGRGCPTGAGPATAEALAESIRSDPGLDTTAPIAVGDGPAEGLMMDVTLASAASGACGYLSSGPGLQVGRPVGPAPGDRMRLYLFDAPKGSSMRILAVVINVSKPQFERAVAGGISVEFRAPKP